MSTERGNSEEGVTGMGEMVGVHARSSWGKTRINLAGLPSDRLGRLTFG